MCGGIYGDTRKPRDASKYRGSCSSLQQRYLLIALEANRNGRKPGNSKRCKVKLGKYLNVFIFIAVMLGRTSAWAQEPATPDAGATAPQRQERARGDGQNGPRPLFGKITSINAGTLVVAKQNGDPVTVKITGQTEFRKEREKAAAADFKVGDTVMVRGEENADHTVTATVIGTRSGGPGGGPVGERSERGGRPMGTLGTDYVAGEVKSIEAPKLTVLRTDNVTQTLELNEETSLRKARESITMADIKIGDHVVARGAVQNGVFVPKGLMVVSPEMWQRMQEMGPQSGAPNAAPAQTVPAKPQE